MPEDKYNFFFSTLALMSLSILVDHSYWKSLQTATGSASSSLSETILRHQNNGAPS